MLLQVSKATDRHRHGRHPRRTAGVGATRAGAGAGEEGQGAWATQQERREWSWTQRVNRVKGLQNRPSRGNSVLGTAPPGCIVSMGHLKISRDIFRWSYWGMLPELMLLNCGVEEDS